MSLIPQDEAQCPVSTVDDSVRAVIIVDSETSSDTTSLPQPTTG